MKIENQHRRTTGSVVLVSVILIVLSAGVSIWFLSKTEAPKTKPVTHLPLDESPVEGAPK